MRACKIKMMCAAAVMCAWSSGALAQVRPTVSTSRIPTTTAAFDNTSLIGKHTLSTRVVRRGALSSMARASVEVAPGKRAQLGSIASAAFKSQQTLKANLSRAASGLFGGVSERDEAIELPDRYIITRTTSAIIKTPATVRNASPMFREHLSGQSGRITLSGLSASERSGLQAFIREAQGYPTNHPMRVAAARGEQAVLDAIDAGEGLFEVTDTIVVPKRAVSVSQSVVSAPRYAQSRLDYTSTQRVNLSPGTTPRTPTGVIQGGQLNPNAQSTVNAHTRYTRGGGTYDGTARRLNGFTFADAWEWERTWRYPSGYLRFGVSAWYGLGLRIPIEVKAQVNPTYLETKQPTDPALSFNVRLSTRPVNGNTAYYQQAGLSPAQVLQGRELAAGGGFHYHVRLRALWTTLLTKSGGKDFHLTGGDGSSGDFTPPIGNATKTTSFFIPASVTRTRMRFGPLKGEIALGVQIGMRGRVTGDVVGLADGRQIACDDRNTPRVDMRAPQRFNHQSATQESVYNCPLPRSNASKNTRYGFRASNLKYHASWSVKPGARGSVRASYKGWGKTFSLTFWLDSVSVPVGSSTFGTHAGTPATVEWQAGSKRFIKQ